MATLETVQLDASHSPTPKATSAFEAVEKEIKAELVRLRHHWNKHEPRMFHRTEGISDADLTAFDVGSDLTEVRKATTPYGTIIFGKIRIPAIDDGYIHARILVVDDNDVRFHTILTEEGNRDADGHPTTWDAIQSEKTPLEFFNE